MLYLYIVLSQRKLCILPHSCPQGFSGETGRKKRVRLRGTWRRRFDACTPWREVGPVPWPMQPLPYPPSSQYGWQRENHSCFKITIYPVIWNSKSHLSHKSYNYNVCLHTEPQKNCEIKCFSGEVILSFCLIIGMNKLTKQLKIQGGSSCGVG